MVDHRLTNEALLAMERGEDVYTSEWQGISKEHDNIAIRGNNDFWCRLVEALHVASKYAHPERGKHFALLYESLSDTLGITVRDA